MARFYRNTLWVHDDGRFLEHAGPDAPQGDAFERFPGLKKLFADNKPVLWENSGRRVMWIPMFRTERSGPLWVGRPVDPSPLAEFRNALVLRVLSIVLLLVVAIWLAARWFANRADNLSHELTDGIRRVVEKGELVTFGWRGPRELKELGENLSRLAVEHNDNIQELQARTRELEASNRYKSEFLANVSHELRTPLNSILLLSKMLADKESGLPRESAHQAWVINEAGRDLRSLIDNILDLSRIEARKTNFNLDLVDLPALIDELAAMMAPQFDAMELPLRVEIDEDAPRQIYSDGDKVRQVVKNFLSNAVKFTRHGEVRLTLRGAKEKLACDCAVRIEVRDTGIGIPRAKHQRIFEAFRQADGSTSRRYGGTGLGLAISRQLARQLGGEIELESREGEGSTFALLLPREFDRERVDEEQIFEERGGELEEQQRRSEEQARFAGHNLLLIDDDVASLLALTPLLESWGIKVNAAGDGDEALEIIDEEERIDLVLIDIMMPDLDGCDTITRIAERAPGIPTIAMALSEVKSSKCGVLNSLGEPLIRKPVDPDELLVRLEKYLGP
jgi:signal transduction histidine kinase/CheY-like chemotaxis protein